MSTVMIDRRPPPRAAAPGPGRSVRALRGRESELSAIAAQLAATADGQGGVLLVEGPPGVGKSWLLREAGTLARDLGLRPLCGQAFESQQSVPFGPLLDATMGSRPPIADVELVRGLSAQPELRYWMLHDLERALESAAADTPLVVMLDDVQWVDPGTLVALSMLPADLARSPILWILALRAGQDRPELADALARLELRGARSLRLEGLCEDAVAAIMTDTLGAEAGVELLELAEHAQGSPFLLVELLRGLLEEGRVRIEDGCATLVGDGLPGRLAESMRQRLARLSGAAQEVAQVASVLGPRFSAEQLAAMLELRPCRLVATLQELIRADLLVERDDRLSFRHDLLHRAVLETLPRSLARALQRDAATVLLASGAAPVEVAHQLAASADVGDREAIATLREAARTWAESDVGAAADLSMRALELMLPVDPERAALVAETVTLLHAAMRPEAARELGERALAGALAPADEAEVRLSLSRMFNRSTEYRIGENRRALALPDLTPTMRARHLALLAYNLAIGGRVPEAATVTDEALAAAADTDDLDARVMATLAGISVDVAHGRCGIALQRITDLRRLIARGHPSYLPALDLQHVNVLSGLGRQDDALQVYEGVMARGRRERNAWTLEVWPQVGCRLRLEAGRLADARLDAGRAEAVLEHVASGSVAGAARMVSIAQLAIHAGDAAGLRMAIEAARAAIGAGSPAIRRNAAWVMALAAMAREDAAEAARWLRDDEMPFAVSWTPADPGDHPSVARIAMAAGDVELARRAVAVTESFARENPDVPLLAATAAWTRGLVDGDSCLLVRAVELLLDTQRPLLRAAAAEDAARALAREGRTEAAIELFDAAFDTFRAHEATADARRVGRAMREHGVRRRVGSPERPASGWGSLTESELRVARLIAGGATNRDAAAQLVVSPHTVSSHLRSAFGKLGVTSRMALARIVLREDQGVGGAAPDPR